MMDAVDIWEEVIGTCWDEDHAEDIQEFAAAVRLMYELERTERARGRERMRELLEGLPERSSVILEYGGHHSVGMLGEKGWYVAGGSGALSVEELLEPINLKGVEVIRRG